MTPSSKQQQTTTGKKHKTIFVIITFFIPVFFFILLEVILRSVNYGGKLDLFVSAPADYEEYLMVNPGIGYRYFFNQSTIPTPQNDVFLKQKPSNGFRVFLLGGSTAAGYPYGSNLMFSRILNLQLSHIYPNKTIEIVNVSTAAINSYSLLDFTDEVLAQSPDAIMIYAGHNEFYGAMGIASAESLGANRLFIKLILKSQNFKTYRLLRNAVNGTGSVFTKMSAKKNEPSGTLMERLVAEQTIPFGSDIYYKGQNQFKENLFEIVEKARHAGVKIVLSELVSNVRDQRPFVSVESAVNPTALNVYLSAINLEKEHKYDEAKIAYIKAKDLDGLRFRAGEDFNRIIHQAAIKFNVPVVPLKRYFEQASQNTLVGETLFLEHLHPNIEGYRLMSDAFFDLIIQEELIAPMDISKQYKFSSKQFQKYTELDSIYGALRIHILKGGWPFKPKGAPNNALIDYYPQTKAESLAVDVWRNKDMNLEHAHVQMAEYYKKKKEFEEAFYEYEALMAMTPYNISPYLGAADMLINDAKYDQALQVLYKSLKIENTQFAHKWIGQILLNQKKTQEALPYLENAFKRNPADLQLAFNIAGAFALLRKYDQALSIIKQLRKKQPNFPGAVNLEKQLNRAMKKN